MSRGPNKDVPPMELLEFMVTHPDPGYTAREISEKYGKTRQWADKQLRDLESDGYVESKNPGGRSKWYWPTTKGKNRIRDTTDN